MGMPLPQLCSMHFLMLLVRGREAGERERGREGERGERERGRETERRERGTTCGGDARCVWCCLVLLAVMNTLYYTVYITSLVNAVNTYSPCRLCLRR